MKTTVNERIKELRNSLNLSQLEFASAVNSTITSVSRMENGSSQPRKSTLKQICNVFSVPEDWLINGIGEMKFNKEEPQVYNDSNPWKDALVSQLKDENHFLKDQIKMMREMLQVLKPSANFLNGNVWAGLKMTDISVRV